MKNEIGAAIVSWATGAPRSAEQLQSGTIPQVSELPEGIRVIVEDIYAQAIAHSFLIAVPVAVVSLIAIVFLPNIPLTRMTTSERVAASEADLATVSLFPKAWVCSPPPGEAARTPRRGRCSWSAPTHASSTASGRRWDWLSR